MSIEILNDIQILKIYKKPSTSMIIISLLFVMKYKVQKTLARLEKEVCDKKYDK